MSDKYIVTLTVDMEVEADSFMDAKAKAIAKLEFCEGVECATAISAEAADIEEFAEMMFGKMRDATEKENKISEEYIKENSTSTGVNIWD